MGIWIDVKGLRKEQGWLQREAAAQLGISRAYLSAVENGKRGISINMMKSIIRVFGVKYEDFSAKNEGGEQEAYRGKWPNWD